MTTPRHLRAALSSLVLAAVLSPRYGHAEELEQCIAAHEASQRDRRDGKLRAAQVQLTACARPACPVPVQQDCTRWLDENEAALPSVLIRVVEAGSDAPPRDVEVSVDGEVVVMRGRALQIDPGDRKFVARAADGRTTERRITIVEGEKQRRIVLDLPVLAPASRPAPDRPRPPEEDGSDALAISLYATLALGTAAGAAFGILAGVGRNAENSAADDCAPLCSDEVVAKVRRLYVAADVVGVFGLVAGATALTLAILYLTDSDPAVDPAQGTAVSLHLVHGGLVVKGRW